MEENEQIYHNKKIVEKCNALVSDLAEVLDKHGKVDDWQHGGFMENVFKRIWDDDDTGERLEDELKRGNGLPDEIKPPIWTQMAMIACAYAYQGMRAKSEPTALHYYRNALEWANRVYIMCIALQEHQKELSMRGKKGAAVAHKKDYARKDKIHEIYRANKYDSKDAAAEIISELLKCPFRTARNHLKGI
jgi:hypothetical protein